MFTFDDNLTATLRTRDHRAFARVRNGRVWVDLYPTSDPFLSISTDLPLDSDTPEAVADRALALCVEQLEFERALLALNEVMA
jgi:hypothetical protein